MNMIGLLPLAVFALSAGAVLLLVWADGRSNRLDRRLAELSLPARRPSQRGLGRLAKATLPRIAASLMPLRSDARTHLQRRLFQAGIFSRQALPLYLSVKVVLLFAPWVGALLVNVVGLVPNLSNAVTAGAFASAAGLLGPSYWLNQRINRRHAATRRGLPDVLDVLVLCLEPGLSLPAAFQLVAAEVQSTHPELGFEMRIVHREMQLGQSLGQGLRSFAERSGLAEVGVLASTVEQTEHLGAGMARSLRAQAEQLRFQRVQQTEERAQKAAGKILMPTLLLIFPSVFVILLGPAALQLRGVIQRRQPVGPLVPTPIPDELKRASPSPPSFRGIP